MLSPFYRYEDADGDSVVNHPTASTWRAKATFGTAIGSYAETTVFDIDAGPDKDFDSDSDNVIYESFYLKTNGIDTLRYYVMKDADGDGAVVDAGSADSCLVDLRYESRSAFLSTTTSLSIRWVVFPHDTSRSYMIRACGFETSSQATVHTTIFGTRPDSCFYAGDTAQLTVVSVRPFDGCVQTDTAYMTVKLGPVPNDSTDDSLLAAHAHATACSGSERDVTFSFASATPIGRGQKPIAGTFMYAVAYGGGESAAVQGSFDQTGIAAIYTDSQGNSLQILWDRDGAVVSQSATK